MCKVDKFVKLHASKGPGRVGNDGLTFPAFRRLVRQVTINPN
eukprot:SAG31_NODE_187_length_20848_cov_22.521953_11_plen_42_part_00